MSGASLEATLDLWSATLRDPFPREVDALGLAQEGPGQRSPAALPQDDDDAPFAAAVPEQAAIDPVLPRVGGAGNSRGGGHELPGRLRGKAAAYSQRRRRGIVGLLLR